MVVVGFFLTHPFDFNSNSNQNRGSVGFQGQNVIKTHCSKQEDFPKAYIIFFNEAIHYRTVLAVGSSFTVGDIYHSIQINWVKQRTALHTNKHNLEAKIHISFLHTGRYIPNVKDDTFLDDIQMESTKWDHMRSPCSLVFTKNKHYKAMPWHTKNKAIPWHYAVYKRQSIMHFHVAFGNVYISLYRHIQQTK